MIWFDWLKIVGVFFVASLIGSLAMLAVCVVLSRPLGRGPERIVDVDNRGNTRIRMPDGSIR